MKNSIYNDIALDCSVKYLASPEWIFTDAELEQFADAIVARCQSVIRARLFTQAQTELQVAHNNALYCAIHDINDHFGD
jgi:hypothetical protein